MPIPKRALAALAALLAVIASGGTIILTADPNDDRVAPASVTVPVDGPDADTKRDDPLVLSPAAQAELERGVTATDTPGDTHAELAEPLRQPNDTPVVTQEGPLAAQEIAGCRTRFVGNSSSRNGTRPRVIVWHQTVSHDSPGWADQDGLTAMANRRSSGVSWHLLVGSRDGNCTYTVPLTLKAWTQANANPFSIGIEVQAFGDEPSYVTARGKATLLRVTRAAAKQFGIPLQRGKVSGCRVARAGIVEHHDLGTCGGGHVDVASTRWQRNPSGGELAGWDTAPLISALAATACDRACDLRKRNVATHQELKRRNCAPLEQTRSDRCRFLHRRHAALHTAAKREGVKL